MTLQGGKDEKLTGLKESDTVRWSKWRKKAYINVMTKLSWRVDINSVERRGVHSQQKEQYSQ